MEETVKEYLKSVIPKISQKIIDSIGEGSILDKPLKDQPFYQSLARVIFKMRHNYNIDVSAAELIGLCYEYMVTKSIKKGETKEEAIKNYKRFFGYKRQRKHLVNIETITVEVVDYIENGGGFVNKTVKSYPFYEKIRTFAKGDERYRDLTFFEILEVVRDYYFANVDKFGNGKKLTEEDFSFSKVLPTYTVTIQSLADEVLMYVRSGGRMDEISKSNLPFYKRFYSYIDQKEDKENWGFHRVLEEVKNYYFANIYPNEEEKDRLNESDFNAKDGRIGDLTLDVLAKDVANYIRGGGNLKNDINRRDFPFTNRFAAYIKKQKSMGVDMDYADLMYKVREHYLSNVAPYLNEEDRVSEESFEFEMHHKYVNQFRVKNLRKLNNLLESIKDEDGCVDALYENKKAYNLIQHLSSKYGMTVFETVALLLPENSNLYLTRGDVHTEYVSDIGYLISEFVRKHGAQNFISNVSENDPGLLWRIKHLARYFPGGTQSVSNVLYFYGICNKSAGDREYKHIDEDFVISCVRKKYEEAVKEYLLDCGDCEDIDMELINEKMALSKHKLLYGQLMLLALKDDMTLIDYLNSKEIVCYDSIQDENDAEVLVRKKINGKDIPSFEYVTGTLKPRLSRTAVKEGKEYTFYLRNLMKEKLENSVIINDEGYSSDEKFEERLKLASSVIEESIESNYHSKSSKKRCGKKR